MANPTLMNKVLFFDTVGKDTNNIVQYSKASFDTLPAYPTKYPIIFGFSPVLYDPSLTPTDISNLSQKIDYSTTPPVFSSNFFLTYKQRVLPYTKTTFTSANEAFYSYINETTTDKAGTYEDFVMFTSFTPATGFYFYNINNNINASYADIQTYVSTNYSKRISITGSTVKISGNTLNTAAGLAVNRDSYTYDDGIRRDVLKTFNEFTPIDNIRAFKIIFEKYHAQNKKYSYQVCYFMPETKY